MIKSAIRLFLSYILICGQTIAYAQSTAAILPQGKTQFFNNNGDPLTSGKVDFYIPNTTTRKTTWQNSDKSIANANPVILDAGGRAIIYGDGTYRQVVKDRNNNIIYDAITASTGTGGGTTGTGDGDLVGTIKPWAGLIAPNQYVFAYGQELSRTTYSALFTAITLQQTSIVCSSGSPTASGFSDTTQIPIGANVESICFSPGTVVLSKTTTTVTFSTNATISTTDNIRIFPYLNGNGSTTFNLPDLRGNVIAGRNNMGGIPSVRMTSAFFGGLYPDSIGQKSGNQGVTLNTTNLPPYTPAGVIGAPVITNTFSTSGTNIFTPAGTNTTPIVNVSGGSTLVQLGAGGVTLSTGGTQVTTSNVTASLSGAPVFSGTPSTLTSVASIPLFSGTAQGGTSTAFSIIQPTMMLNYIIKVTPDSNSADASGVTSLGSMTGDIACGAGLLCTGNIISVLGTPTIGLTQNHIFVGNVSNVATDVALSGDCTIVASGAITCLKTNGTNFGTMAVQPSTNVSISGGSITGMPSPINPSDVATKAYADSLASGLIIHAPVRLATAAVLPNSPVYANGASGVGRTLTAGSNGALSIDSILTVVNNRVLIKDQASALQNGCYTVTTVGDGSNPYVLTGCTDFDTSAEMLAGSYFLVTAGTVNAPGVSFVLATTVATVGTNAVNFNQFSSTSNVTSFNSRTGAVVPASGDYNASQVTYTPGGTSALTLNTQTKLRLYIDIRDFCANADIDGHINNYDCIKAAITEANLTGATVRFSPGLYSIDMTGKTSISVEQSHIWCEPQFGFFQDSPSTLYGAWFFIRGTTASPFTLGQSTSVRNCKWLWPDQTTPGAIAFPAALSLVGASSVIAITDNVVINANIFTHLTHTGGSNGLMQFNNNYMSCFDSCLKIEASAFENFITNNQCHWGIGYNFYQTGHTMPGFAWPNGDGGLFQNYLAANSACIRLTGAGSVDELKAVNNFIGGYFAFIHGTASAGDRYLSGSLIGNGCDHVHYCIALTSKMRPNGLSISGGTMSGACISGSFPYDGCPAQDTSARSIFFGMTGTTSYTWATIGNVSFGASLGGSIVITGDTGQAGIMSIGNNIITGPAGNSTGMLRYNAPNINLTANGNQFDCSNTTNGYGVQIENGANINMSSNQMNNCQIGVGLSGTITRQFQMLNISDNTGTQFVNGAVIGVLYDKCNSWIAC